MRLGERDEPFFIITLHAVRIVWVPFFRGIVFIVKKIYKKNYKKGLADTFKRVVVVVVLLHSLNEIQKNHLTGHDDNDDAILIMV